MITEDKQEICNLLKLALKETNACRDLEKLYYHNDTKKRREVVTAVFRSGERRDIDVTGESGWGLVRSVSMWVNG